AGIRGLSMGMSLAAAIGLAAMTGPARADEAAAKLAADHLYAGTLAEGDTALTAILAMDPQNGEAKIGLATVKFVRAIEKLSQGLYRYGLQQPRNSFMLPVLRLPVPVNPNPEPITYEAFRGLLSDFAADIGATEKLLGEMGPEEFKFPLDLARVRYDINGDGGFDPEESMLGVLTHVTGVGRDRMPADLTFAFDRADAYWLQGYCNVILGVDDFFLAYDWHESFEYTFHLFFPKSDLPFTRALDAAGPDDFTNIADLISFLHVRWPLADAKRMSDSRAAFKKAVTLSRKDWDAIEAETDNDREWLPNPKQTGRFAGFTVTEDRIKAWRAVLDQVDLMLDGKKLVPHWRFRQGFNLAKVFEEPRPFDIVLWVTGPAALPYLQDGPIGTSQDWNGLAEVFEGSFGIYMAWFN
ncbi:MAG: hypothetical protein J0H63_00915, partial [Rhizobiales bacterium]|nr:hypothetical protein [Hyphomicrobiales bacterium]